MISHVCMPIKNMCYCLSKAMQLTQYVVFFSLSILKEAKWETDSS